jgi:hypothetical protein
MIKTQIYLLPEQYEFLNNVATAKSQEIKKRVSVSEIVRNSIGLLKEQYFRNKTEEKDLLYLKSYANPTLKEVWDNDKDSVYDEL